MPTYEFTAGGPIFVNTLWFFGAGRLENADVNVTTPYTGYNYTRTTDEKRYEGKLTYALNSKNTAKFSYIKNRLDTINNHYTSATAVLDQRSLYDNANDEQLLSLNYTSVLKDNLFLEGQYSNRQLSFIGTGSQFTDLVRGTPIWDRSRSSARFNSPTFCAVCGSGIEQRDNWNAFVKASYFLSTSKTGSHNFVGGFDVYKEMRKNDNYQSGSNFRVQATRTIIDGQNIYPVFQTGTTTYVDFLPLVSETKGNDIRTYSFFVNDAWRFSSRFTFNVGARYDRNHSKDQGGSVVVKDSNWSPRLGLTWDVTGDGKWKANAGFARYVMGISTAIVDAGSVGGRTATYSYFYRGPSINTGTSGPYMTADEALPILFNWFFDANGAQSGYPKNLTTRNPPTVPGVTTAVGDGLKAPNSDEVTFGLARELGGKGAARVDYVYRRLSRLLRRLPRHVHGQGVRAGIGADVRSARRAQHERRGAELQGPQRAGELPALGRPPAWRQLHVVVGTRQRRRGDRYGRSGARERERHARVSRGELELPGRLHERRSAPQGAGVGELHAADRSRVGPVRSRRDAALRLRARTMTGRRRSTRVPTSRTPDTSRRSRARRTTSAAAASSRARASGARTCHSAGNVGCRGSRRPGCSSAAW